MAQDPEGPVPSSIDLTSVGPFRASRIALKYEPPTLVLELKHEGSQRLFNHRIRFSNLSAKMDPSWVCEQVLEQNKVAFSDVSKDQVTRLLGLLIAHAAGGGAGGESKESVEESETAPTGKGVVPPPPPVTVAVEAAAPSAPSSLSPKEDSILEESVVEEEYSEVVEDDEDDNENEQEDRKSLPVPPIPAQTGTSTGLGALPPLTNRSSEGTKVDDPENGDSNNEMDDALEESVPLSEANSAVLSTGDTSMQSGDIDDLLNDIGGGSPSPRPGAKGGAATNDDDDDDSYSFSASPLAPPAKKEPATAAAAVAAGAEGSEGEGEGEGAGRGGIDLGAIDDLQRVDETFLASVKDKMGEDFQKKAITKDHPDYVYDKQVDFGSATESNDWDDDD